MAINPLRDPELLAAGQYAGRANLDARSALHDRFSAAPHPFRVWEAHLVDWGEARNVLDVGTGTGRFWDNPSLPRHLELTLVDISPTMVAAASGLARQCGYRSVAAQVADAQTLPLPDGSMDVVVANHMLYHVPEPAAALAEFRRVLKDDGTLLVATNARGHMRQLNDLIADVLGAFELGLNDVFGIEAGELALREHFSEITWHSFVNPLLVTDPEAIVDYSTSIEPASSCTPEQRSMLRDAARRAIAAGDGTMRIDTRTGVFVCAGQSRSR